MDLSWQLIAAITTGTGALGRLLWSRLRRPSAPTLLGRIWSFALTVGDREVDNQRLRRQLAARDELIVSLMSDLDRASGIDSLRGSREDDHHPQPSETPMHDWRRRLSDTTE